MSFFEDVSYRVTLKRGYSHPMPLPTLDSVLRITFRIIRAYDESDDFEVWIDTSVYKYPGHMNYKAMLTSAANKEFIGWSVSDIKRLNSAGEKT